MKRNQPMPPPGSLSLRMLQAPEKEGPAHFLSLGTLLFELPPALLQLLISQKPLQSSDSVSLLRRKKKKRSIQPTSATRPCTGASTHLLRLQTIRLKEWIGLVLDS